MVNAGFPEKHLSVFVIKNMAKRVLFWALFRAWSL